jgi:trans-aconitate methyltransferase
LDLKEQSVSKETTRHPWELARAKSINHLIKDYLKDSESVMVDFGCGDLFFMDYTLDNYPKAKGYGFDIGFSTQDLEDLSLNYPKIIPVNSKDNLDTLLSAKRADIVFLMDVIEHVENDQQILESIIKSDWFDTKSHLIVTVPAYQILFNSHDVFLEHYRRYTNSGLSKIVTAAGFEIVEKGYFFSSLLIPRAISKLKEKLSPPKSFEKSELVDWKGGASITNLITQTLYSDFRVNHWLNSSLGITPPGLSNYMVCQKPA